VFVACSLTRYGDFELYDAVTHTDFSGTTTFTDYVFGSHDVHGTNNVAYEYGEWVNRNNPDIFGDFDIDLSVWGGCDTAGISAQASYSHADGTGDTVCWPSTQCYLTVTVNSGGYLSGGDASGYYDCSACVTLAAFPNDGWRFDGWSGDVVSESPVASVCMNGTGRNATAYFTQEPPPPPPPPPPGDQNGGNTDYSGTGSPIILNLDGGAFHLSSLDEPVQFDINADGTRETMAWTLRGSPDAFVALDLNQNGVIDNGAEMFGDSTRLGNGTKAPNGFEALRDYDRNHDSVIDALDGIWQSLVLWNDVNHDGVSQANELLYISKSPLIAISLDYHWTGRRDQHGNTYRYESLLSIKRGAATVHQPVYDVFFAVAP
jgi:hypothetical protein